MTDVGSTAAVSFFRALADELERDPELSSDNIPAALTAAAAAFAATLQPPSPSGAPESASTAVTPPPPPTEAAVQLTESAAAEPSPVPTLYKCPQCGAYFTAPTTCTNQHEPAATVTLDAVPTPPPAAEGAAVPGAAEGAAVPTGPGSPPWPAGS